MDLQKFIDSQLTVDRDANGVSTECQLSVNQGVELIEYPVLMNTQQHVSSTHDQYSDMERIKIEKYL